jgi:hypothetical protein
MKANKLMLLLLNPILKFLFLSINIRVETDIFSAHERQQVSLLYSRAVTVTAVLARKQDPPFALSPTTLFKAKGLF